MLFRNSVFIQSFPEAIASFSFPKHNFAVTNEVKSNCTSVSSKLWGKLDKSFTNAICLIQQLILLQSTFHFSAHIVNILIETVHNVSDGMCKDVKWLLVSWESFANNFFSVSRIAESLNRKFHSSAIS